VIGHVDLLATPGRPPERDIPDVQGSHDPRNIAIGLVGVKGVRYPLRWGSGPERQAAVGDFTMSVSLPADQKGTHMSRFIAMLEEHSASGEGLDVAGLARMHGQMLERLQARRGRLEVSLTLFVRKAAPVSGVQSLMDYQLKVVVEGEAQTAVTEVQLVVPVTSLCPCSKTISDYGAHNQRSHVTMWVEARPVIEPQELIRLAEDEASCELWGVLKRADEKYVTERAYDNPKFVEDLIRDVAARLSKDARIGRYAVEVENFESIHNHSAWARIESN
jgi:GTP cyclohydrolase I